MSASRRRVVATSIAASLAGSVVFGAVLLGIAGTVDWPAAWAWVAMFVVAGLAGAVLAPEAVLRERLRGPLRPGQARADIAFVAVFGLLFAGWIVLLPLDAVRFEWSALAPGWQALGAGAVVAGNVVALLALCANPFASASVRVVEEQRVATTGPYAVVRHPMYAGVLLFVPGTAAMLGSLYGVVASPLLLASLFARVAIEERALRAGLPGYDEYASRVPYRLVPGVW